MTALSFSVNMTERELARRAGQLRRLKRDLRRHGITQRRIARRARVTPMQVYAVLRGLRTSRPVLTIADRLLREALRRRPQRPRKTA